MKRFTEFMSEDAPRYFVRQLTGRLSNGAERGKGTKYHAVPDESAWATALCGAKPGRRSGSGFVEPADPQQVVTCPKCLQKLQKLHEEDNTKRYSPMRYERITFIEKPSQSAQTIILRITRETDVFLTGIEVDTEGVPVVKQNTKAKGTVDETQHLISKDLLKRRVPMRMNLFYGTLEAV